MKECNAVHKGGEMKMPQVCVISINVTDMTLAQQFYCDNRDRNERYYSYDAGISRERYTIHI